jgi:hypothetical protein
MNKPVLTTLLVLLGTSALAVAGSFPSTVANDVYAVAQGGTVNGTPTANDDNDGVPDIHDAINQLLGTSYSHNYAVDPLFVEPDEVWTNVTGVVALIGLSAGNSNTLGVYTDLGVGAVKTAVLGPYSGFGFTGDGTIANPYPAAMTGLSSDTQFGWYLNSSGANYYSESALNGNGLDHMMTFDLPGLEGKSLYIDAGNGPWQITLNDPYLICWEDLPWSGGYLGDEDYDDMMYIIDVARVPLPGAILLGVIGLSCAGYRLKRQTA